MTKSGLNNSTEIAVMIRTNTEKNIHITPIPSSNLDVHVHTYGSHDSHMIVI